MGEVKGIDTWRWMVEQPESTGRYSREEALRTLCHSFGKKHAIPDDVVVDGAREPANNASDIPAKK